ncbi:hypothetical protein EQ718_12610 [Paracoccus versutus]|uniref:LysR substrate-binding domain-containing protein n=1 Tax=Paracoccus versutus TaxID=34007 RepID=A0AAQ0HBM1_PARVE|nr:hypothetical protein [Paracoccus versutus]KGJ01751.1 hypothetical protein IT40_26900 [Paracoccus versutus]REG26292.1 hypothetical protein ATH84_10942 [Paracoccus versutus]WEJ79642.1 hypothetical protein EQ718_12610 [Paracoccus versutus]
MGRSGGVATSLVQAGLGMTIQPECLIYRDRLGEVAVVRGDEPWAKRQILIATAQGRVPGRAASVLTAQLLAPRLGLIAAPRFSR